MQDLPYFYARERALRLKRLREGISKPTLDEDYLRYMSEHHKEKTPENGLHIKFMKEWFKKANLEGSAFHRDFEAILLEGWEAERQKLTNEITVSFKKHQNKKYAIILMAGVVIGVILVTCLPMVLKAVAVALSEPAPPKEPVIRPATGKEEIQLTTRQVLVLFILRVIYVHFRGN